MKRRIIILVFAVAGLALLARSEWKADTADPPTELPSGPITQIASVEDLVAFAESVNAGNNYSGITVKLTSDITLDINTANQVTQIGINDYDKDNPFSGTFDGQGYTISGLFIQAKEGDNTGLFRYVKGGTIKNLIVSGSILGNRNNVGGIVGYLRKDESGGGAIENCYFSGDVGSTGSEYGSNIGGIVGYNNGGTVKSCYNTGTAAGVSNIGGIVGHNDGSVENCYNTGEMRGDRCGGIVGYNVDGSIANCYSTGNVSGNDSSGIVGIYTGYYGDETNYGTVTNCYFLQDHGAVVPGAGESKTAAEFCSLASDLGGSWKDHPILGRPVLAAIPEGAAGTEEDPYLISNLTELEGVRDYVNGGNSGAGEFFKLTENINMSGSYNAAGESWTPIGTGTSQPFSGTFDGGEPAHTISGLYIDTSNTYRGLFGCVGSGGTVKNLDVEGNVTGGDTCGGIVGYNYGVIENCAYAGSVESVGGYVGGIAGVNYEGTITGCANDGGVAAAGNDAGGIVGYNYGTVENCYNTGSVESGNMEVGGIAGANNFTAIIRDCHNEGVITATNGTNNAFAGGIVGNNMDGTVERCGNTGDIITQGTNAGGVTGSNGADSNRVANCYNTGSVTGYSNIGGVIGSNSRGTLINCYNTGSVEGTSTPGYYIGGVVGFNVVGTVTTCYYLAATADGGINGADTDGATAKTEDEFNSGEVAWLLQNGQSSQTTQVWGQTVGSGYPQLTEENTVYRAVFSAYQTQPEEYRYVNSGGRVTPPALPDNTQWYDESGKVFTASNSIMSDKTLTAYLRVAINAAADPTITTNYGQSAEQDLDEWLEYEDGTSVAGNFTYSFADASAKGGLDGAEIAGSILTIPDDAAVKASGYTLRITATEVTPNLQPVPPAGANYEAGVVSLNVTVIVSRAGSGAAPKVTIDYAKESLAAGTDIEYNLTGAADDAWTACAANMPLSTFSWDGSRAVTVYFRYAATNDFNASEAQVLTVPARPAAPAVELALVKTSNSITVTNTSGNGVYEYSINQTNWTSGAFTGLRAATAYTVYVRAKATDSAFASSVLEWPRKATTTNADGSGILLPGEQIGNAAHTGDSIIVKEAVATLPESGIGVEVDRGGNVAVPSGSTVTPPSGGVHIVVRGSGTIWMNGDGDVTLPAGGSAGIGAVSLTLPAGGTLEPDAEGCVAIPGGASVSGGGVGTMTVPVEGGVITAR